MSNKDHENLLAQMKANADTVRAFAEQIESGQYGDSWTVFDADNDDQVRDGISAPSAEAAIEAYLEIVGDDGRELYAERNPADEPTVDETPISEYPLEIVDERGREFAVVLSTGGPHIEVVADGLSSARLEGYWWGDRATLHGDYLSTFLDYFIER